MIFTLGSNAAIFSSLVRTVKTAVLENKLRRADRTPGTPDVGKDSERRSRTHDEGGSRQTSRS